MKKMKKFIASIMTGIVALSGVVFTGCAGNETGNVPVPPPQTEQTEQSGGFDVSGSQESGISLLTATIAETDYETYGVSAEAESAITVTASYTPEYVTNPELDWEVGFWLEDITEWATGKTVTDYVTVTPTENGATTAVVECFKPFASRICVWVGCRQDRRINAYMLLDYQTKLTNVSMEAYYEDEDTGELIDSDGDIILFELENPVNRYSFYDNEEFFLSLPCFEFSPSWYEHELVYLKYWIETVGTLDGFDQYGFTYEFVFAGAVSELFFEKLGYEYNWNFRSGAFSSGTIARLLVCSFEDEQQLILETGYYTNGQELDSSELEYYTKFCQIMDEFVGDIIGYIVMSVDDNICYARPIVLAEQIFQIEMQSVSVDTTAYTF